MPTDEQAGWTFATMFKYFEERTEALERSISTQKQHTDQIVAAQKEAVQVAMTAADRAVTKAETAAEKRFEGVNEFRAAMNDRERAFMPRMELEVLIKGLDNRINELTSRIDRNEGRTGGVSQGWGWAIGAIGLILAVASFLLRK